MNADAKSPGQFRVVIVGGGVAALEAMFALQELAGDRLSLTLVAPDERYVERALSVGEPFAQAADAGHAVSDLAALAGAEHLLDGLDRVDRDQRIVHTTGGDSLPYDALMLATGARHEPAYPKVTTIDDAKMDEVLHGLVQDLELGYSHSVAFLAAAGPSWPLPLYELALMSAHRAFEMGEDVVVSLVTFEATPLEFFGIEASAAVASLLETRGISFRSTHEIDVTPAGVVTLGNQSEPLTADRIVALPALRGPGIRGLPAEDRGFMAIDEYCRVRGTERVFAAGDATDSRVKHGGIAAAQAACAARGIAAIAGVQVEPSPFRAVAYGKLLTGAAPLYLSAEILGGRVVASSVGSEPMSPTGEKTVTEYLHRALVRLRTPAPTH